MVTQREAAALTPVSGEHPAPVPSSGRQEAVGMPRLGFISTGGRVNNAHFDALREGLGQARAGGRSRPR